MGRRATSAAQAMWADRSKRWLLAIVLVGLVLRLAMAVYLGDTVEVTPSAFDQVHFENVALSLLAGKGFTFTRPPWPFIEAGAPTSYVSFLYTLFVAAVYWVFGTHALPVRIIQALVCSLMPWQVYLLTREILDDGPWTMDHGRWTMDDGRRREAVALVAAGITAGYAYFAYFSATLMTEGFYLMAVVWSLDLTLRLAKRPTARRWASWGLAVTLASLLRQVFMPMALLCFAYVWARARRQVRLGHVALAGTIAAALILPWTVRNYLVFDRFVLLNTQAGQVFWNSNHPDLGTEFEGAMFDIPADLKGMSEAELDTVLMRRGLQNVAADPGRFARLSWDRLAVFLRFWPEPYSPALSNVARTASFAICLPFMAVGLVLSLRRLRTWLLLHLFIGAYTFFHVISWPGIRYRMPVDVALVPFAALAIVSAITWLRRKRGAAVEHQQGGTP